MRKTIREASAWLPASQDIYASNRIERARLENQATLREFAQWLSQERGLAPSSIATRLGTACSFVDEITERAGMPCAQAFGSLTPAGVEDSFVRYGKDHGPAARRSMQAAMRSFLQFAVSRGWVGRELSAAVPSLPTYRLSSVPRGLNDTELSTVLSAPWEAGRCPLRNRSIVVMLATYGVRREQVSALRFEDIDWNEGTLVFAAHKGGKAVLHTLTGAVAASLADYLRQERPVSESTHVFLRCRRPHLRLGPAAITQMVRARMVHCGLPPYSPHRFRHAFATRLLRCGQSVKAIADLLGHRSLEAVAIYAKVDHARLLEVAIDWPVEVAS